MSVKLVKSNKLLMIILLSLIVIATVILINLLSFSNIDALIIKQIKSNQLMETEHAASQFESHMNSVRDELVTFSKFPLMETLNPNQCIEDINEADFKKGSTKELPGSIGLKTDSLFWIDSDGTIIGCSSPKFSNYLGINIKNKEYFKLPKETNEPYITGIVKEGASQQIIISVPLFETKEYTPYPNFLGDFQGVLMSIIEINSLYNFYILPIIENDKNMFMLVDLNTEETILKSDNIEEYSKIKSSLPKTSRWFDEIIKLDQFGETIITSSDMAFGSETWRLIVFTPLKNIGQEIKSVQARYLFSLILVIVVIIGIFLFLIHIYKSKEEVQFELDKTKVTLEKFGITIDVEKEKYTPADIVLDTRHIYLVKEDNENHAHELFIGTLNRGFAGLGLVREDPRTLRSRYNLEKTSFIWLTKTKISNIPSETDINNLFELIAEFIKKSKKSVVLLDRMDYLLTENKFDDVIKMIHGLNDMALANDCIIILSINPDIIEDQHLRAIEAETIDIYGKHLRSKIELSELEINILKYINNNNVINKLASYKDITANFNITKPTTRVKINRLQGLGLLQIDQRGRFKSLKITSVGRKIV